MPLYLEVDCANINIGDIGFCNCAPCFEDEGDCDFHEECQENLLCGAKNCPHPLLNSLVDCCYAPTLRDCTSNNPCGEYEGHCDSANECLGYLSCGTDNCLESLGFSQDVNCCEDVGRCIHDEWKGDSVCDDGNNNEGCEWDGGDCCGSNVNTEWCDICECLDPGFKRKHNLHNHKSIKHGSVSMVKKYVLAFEQWHYTPEVRSCVDYPNEKYQSYEECDQEFVKQRTKDIGVIPFWATDNFEDVTKEANSSIELWEFFDGSLESTCK